MPIPTSLSQRKLLLLLLIGRSWMTRDELLQRSHEALSRGDSYEHRGSFLASVRFLVANGYLQDRRKDHALHCTQQGEDALITQATFNVVMRGMSAIYSMRGGSDP